MAKDDEHLKKAREAELGEVFGREDLPVLERLDYSVRWAFLRSFGPRKLIPLAFADLLTVPQRCTTRRRRGGTTTFTPSLRGNSCAPRTTNCC